jgi:hypothetical protein
MTIQQAVLTETNLKYYIPVVPGHNMLQAGSDQPRLQRGFKDGTQ